MRCVNCPYYHKAQYESDDDICWCGIPEDETFEDSKGNFGCRYNSKTLKNMNKKYVEFVNDSMSKEYANWVEYFEKENKDGKEI